MLNKIQGLIFGAAVGDSLGFVVEKRSFQEAQTFIQELKSGQLKTITHRTYPQDYKFGQFSDDTQFSLALIESLLESPGFDPGDFLNRLIVRHKNNELVGLGKNTKKILNQIKNNQSYFDLTKNSSNGSIMRAWAVGLFFKDKASIDRISEIQSRLTHDHEEAILSCQVIAQSVNHLLRNDQKLDNLKKIWAEYLDLGFLDLSHEEFLNRIKTKYGRDDWEYVSPGALVTLEVVLFSLNRNFENFQDALFEGISFGGDTDSVASLIGALMGLKLGIESIPEKWIKSVHDSKYNFKTIDDLIQKIWLIEKN